MLFRVSHRTHYAYSESASICHNELHLVPRTSLQQTCLHYELAVTPTPAVVSRRTDYYGNDVTYFTLQEMHRELDVRVVSLVNVLPSSPPASTPPWEEVARRLRADHDPALLEACQFSFESPFVEPDPDLEAYARVSFTDGRPVLEAALDLTHRVFGDFTYDAGYTTVSTPVREVFAARRGVCQDFSHLMLAALRSLGLAARYVSGYLGTRPTSEGGAFVGADASHAWLSIYCLDGVWVDLDPTNDMVPSDRHITLAWGRDYGDVTPIKGVVQGGGKHVLTVAVNVEPVDSPGEVRPPAPVVSGRPVAEF